MVDVAVVVVVVGSPPIYKKHELNIPTSHRFTWTVLGTKEVGRGRVREFPPHSILQHAPLAVVVEEAAIVEYLADGLAVLRRGNSGVGIVTSRSPQIEPVVRLFRQDAGLRRDGEVRPVLLRSGGRRGGAWGQGTNSYSYIL